MPLLVLLFILHAELPECNSCATIVVLFYEQVGNKNRSDDCPVALNLYNKLHKYEVFLSEPLRTLTRQGSIIGADYDFSLKRMLLKEKQNVAVILCEYREQIICL